MFVRDVWRLAVRVTAEIRGRRIARRIVVRVKNLFTGAGRFFHDDVVDNG